MHIALSENYKIKWKKKSIFHTREIAILPWGPSRTNIWLYRVKEYQELGARGMQGKGAKSAFRWQIPVTPSRWFMLGDPAAPVVARFYCLQAALALSWYLEAQK